MKVFIVVFVGVFLVMALLSLIDITPANIYIGRRAPWSERIDSAISWTFGAIIIFLVGYIIH